MIRKHFISYNLKAFDNLMSTPTTHLSDDIDPQCCCFAVLLLQTLPISQHQKNRLLLQINGKEESSILVNSSILSHFAYTSFRIIFLFDKSCHMLFH